VGVVSDSEFVGTTAVRAGHGFDVGALERYLRSQIDGFSASSKSSSSRAASRTRPSS
jgi:hypothetical protein